MCVELEVESSEVRPGLLTCLERGSCALRENISVRDWARQETVSIRNYKPGVIAF